MEKENVKIEMPVENFNDYVEEYIGLQENQTELWKILDLIFENAGFGADKYHLTILFDNELMSYLKIKHKERYEAKLEELKMKKEKQNNE